MSIFPNRASLLLPIFLCGGLTLVPALGAAGRGFTATLSASQQTEAGLAALSADECAALDRFVAGDLTVVRNGDAPELAGSFVSRRTEAERKAAGLDRLTEAQLTRLNELAAAILVSRPKPKERPRIRDSGIFSAERKPEIHGAVTVGYGWSGGGSYWTGSLWLGYYDPDSGFGMSIGLSNFDGKGFHGYGPGYLGGGYYLPRPIMRDIGVRDGRTGARDGDAGQLFRRNDPSFERRVRRDP